MYATKLKRVYLKQKHAPPHLVFNKGKLTHVKPLFENLSLLNIYQKNISNKINISDKHVPTFTLYA